MKTATNDALATEQDLRIKAELKYLVQDLGAIVTLVHVAFEFPFMTEGFSEELNDGDEGLELAGERCRLTSECVEEQFMDLVKYFDEEKEKEENLESTAYQLRLTAASIQNFLAAVEALRAQKIAADKLEVLNACAHLLGWRLPLMLDIAKRITSEPA